MEDTLSNEKRREWYVETKIKQYREDNSGFLLNQFMATNQYIIDFLESKNGDEDQRKLLIEVSKINRMIIEKICQ